MHLRTHLGIGALVFACGTSLFLCLGHLRQFQCTAMESSVTADGRFHTVARLTRSFGAAPDSADIAVTGVDPSSVALQPNTQNALLVLYRAPVAGVNTRLRVDAGKQQWSIPLRASPDWNDAVGDGFPEALRLHDAEDRTRFRRWFTAIADQAAATRESSLPAEVTDCSALLRYSYRLALTRHDDRWYKQYPPGTMPFLPSVQQWSYPQTALGAALFRITPARRSSPEPADFAAFADAKTLYSRNSFRVGRDIHVARPGDLLFFHQLEGEQQYHSMIVTGAGGEWVVYHTGPDGAGATRIRGEMRRAQVTDLLQHPDPRWRPTANNPNFLGVFRWNLLRED